MKTKLYVLTVILLVAAATGYSGEKQSVVAPGALVTKLAGGFSFTEGPATDTAGNIFFSDIPNNRIHKWSLDDKLTIFLENSGGANGLFFDKTGNLLACEGGGRRLVSINPRTNGSTVSTTCGLTRKAGFISPIRAMGAEIIWNRAVNMSIICHPTVKKSRELLTIWSGRME